MKKKDKSGGKTGKIPKQIGGIKLSKTLRKTGEALLETANSPIGRELIATGITAAVMAVAAARTKTAHEAGVQAKADAKEAVHAGADHAQVIADTIGNAAEAVMKRVFAGKTAG